MNEEQLRGLNFGLLLEGVLEQIFLGFLWWLLLGFCVLLWGVECVSILVTFLGVILLRGYPGRFLFLPTMFGEDFGEEELPILPRHTKVVVTGNNRTKSVLIGLHGVVKKAVGLGGWHWLVLTNGDEVKLQRNALSVIEAPTGYEVDDAEVVDFSSSTGSDLVPRSSPRRKLTVNLRKLETAALRRYWRHFKLEEMNYPAYSKEQLIQAVEKHFISLQLDEFQVIAGFLRAAKRLKRSTHSVTG